MDYEPVRINYFYNTSPDSIFDAWVNPATMRKWLFVSPTSEITNIEITPEVNGRFSIIELEQSNGESIDHFGEYLEVDRPNRLVFTLSVPKHFPGETCVTVEIETRKFGSELKLTQTGVSPEITTNSWRKMLKELSSVL